MVARLTFCLLICLPYAVANAAIDAYQFPSEDMRVRYHRLIDELRCPQCLNTNIAGSDAMIAKDLRREVHRLLIAGKSDAEILEFMYQSYGDFILYKPRLKAATIVLWFGPPLLLCVAIVILVVIMRRRGRPAAEQVDSQRLEALLARREPD